MIELRETPGRVSTEFASAAALHDGEVREGMDCHGAVQYVHLLNSLYAHFSMILRRIYGIIVLRD